ncbi:hypothetical protein QKT49_gp032 [Acanthamoeba castellanii medusavirus]|uniref:Uncharacterized protein n=1 Tax=Acanthamoeba castellanii medusavirus J1 TaxID=3114988 RepID=A0A3T1CWG8_9VIRU|nr:hypothetical protein QKT49_gp032 [Acanthamoeba castellanii medusavirus]BBI30172.1 hypothetical protein [Acanthamoeba castellanii medusavirus J1]
MQAPTQQKRTRYGKSAWTGDAASYDAAERERLLAKHKTQRGVKTRISELLGMKRDHERAIAAKQKRIGAIVVEIARLEQISTQLPP